MARRRSITRSRTAAKKPFLLTICAATGKQFTPFLRRHLGAAHGLIESPLAELSIALVGDRQMAILHERFLGIKGPTDVLTFPLEADSRGRAISGEVVVCVPEAKRRAKVERTDLSRELLLYALHGMLHLCGFDDRTAAAFAAMHRREDMILTQLGVGPVFDALRGVRNGSQASRLHGRRKDPRRTRVKGSGSAG